MIHRPYPQFPNLEIEISGDGVRFRCWKCHQGIFAPNEVLEGTTNHVLVHRHGDPIRVIFQKAPLN